MIDFPWISWKYRGYSLRLIAPSIFGRMIYGQDMQSSSLKTAHRVHYTRRFRLPPSPSPYLSLSLSLTRSLSVFLFGDFL